jgi:hypothetical protein
MTPAPRDQILGDRRCCRKHSDDAVRREKQRRNDDINGM